MDLQKIPLDHIQPHPNNVRRDVGDVTELAESIRAQGLLQPLVIAPRPHPGDVDGKPWVLIAGHRRHAASSTAELSYAWCVVRDDLDTESKQLEAMLVENLQRTDLTPMEEAEGYQQLLTFDGYTVATVAKKTGRGKSTVTSRLKLTKLPENVRERVHGKQISLVDAEKLAEFAGAPTVLAALVRQLGTPNFRWALEEARRERERAATIVKARKEIEKSGAIVLSNFPDDDSPYVRLTDLVIDDDEGDSVNVKPGGVGWAAFVNRSGEPVWYCTNPAEHGWCAHWDWEERHPNAVTDPADGPAKPTAPRTLPPKEPTEAELARQKIKDDLEVAAQIRRDHVRKLLAATVPPPGVYPFVTSALCEVAETGGLNIGAIALDLLGLASDTHNWRVMYDALIAAAGRKTWAVIAAIACGDAESYTDDASNGDMDCVQIYLKWLVEHTGYELSDVEREHLLKEEDEHDTAAESA